MNSIYRTLTAIAHLTARRIWPQISDNTPDKVEAANCFLPAGYQSRSEPKYFDDLVPETTPRVYQPDVYSLAELLARCTGRRIIDVGCGKGYKLSKLSDHIDVIGIDFGPNIAFCREHYALGEWRTADFDSDAPLPISDDEAAGSILVCADVIEHLRNPLRLLQELRRCIEAGAVGLISTPERRLLRGGADLGPPRNPAHVREWSIGELRAMLGHVGIPTIYVGLTANNHIDRHMTTSLAVCGTGPRMDWMAAPSGRGGNDASCAREVQRAA